MNNEEPVTGYYISTLRIPYTQLTEECFDKNEIKIGKESFRELLDGKRRHKVRTLVSPVTEEKIIIVK
jgi:hypothetical protein